VGATRIFPPFPRGKALYFCPQAAADCSGSSLDSYQKKRQNCFAENKNPFFLAPLLLIDAARPSRYLGPQYSHLIGFFTAATYLSKHPIRGQTALGRQSRQIGYTAGAGGQKSKDPARAHRHRNRSADLRRPLDPSDDGVSQFRQGVHWTKIKTSLILKKSNLRCPLTCVINLYPLPQTSHDRFHTHHFF